MQRTTMLVILTLVAHAAAAQGDTAPPSYAELRARSCPRGGTSAAVAILYGHVLDADTDAPVAGANLSLVFTDSSGPTLVERVRRAKSATDGAFVICALPERYAGTLQAVGGTQATPDVPITSADPSLTTTSLALNVSGARTAIVRGRVTGPDGQPAADAQVSVEGAAANATTGPTGEFELTGLPSGTQLLAVKKNGFRPARIGVRLTTRAPTQVMAMLGGTQTAPVTAGAGRFDDALRKVGFTERRASGKGIQFDPNDVDQRHPQRITDLLVGLRGLHVTDVGPSRLIAGMGTANGRESGCVNVWVDGAIFSVTRPGDLDEAYPAAALAAVEVYASDVEPPRVFYSVSRGCPTIAIWTKGKLSKVSAP